MIEGCTHLGVHGPQVENLCNMYVYVEHNFSLEWGGGVPETSKDAEYCHPKLSSRSGSNETCTTSRRILTASWYGVQFTMLGSGDWISSAVYGSVQCVQYGETI